MNVQRRLPDDDVRRYILEVLPVGGSKDLVDIIDDVDYRQRLVPDREELNRALTELTASGAIAEIGSRKFQRPSEPGAAMRFTPLSEAEYAGLVIEYHRRFEDALMRASRSRAMSGIDAFVKRRYGPIGLRGGTTPERTDLERTTAAIIVFNRVEEAGGSCMTDEMDAATFAVSGVRESGRRELCAAIRNGLERYRLPAARLRLRFDDGSVMRVTDGSSEGQG